MAGDPIKQAEEMLAEGVGLSEYASSMSVDKEQRLPVRFRLAESFCYRLRENTLYLLFQYSGPNI